MTSKRREKSQFYVLSFLKRREISKANAIADGRKAKPS